MNHNTTSTIERAAKNIRFTQSPLALRKESLTALAALLVWVATLVAENVDAIPAVAGAAGQILGVVASCVAFGVSRFTVPALTRGQQQRLIAETQRLEVESQPHALPVYTGPTVDEVPRAD